MSAPHFLQQGISYVEVLLATLLLSIALVPLMETLTGSLQLQSYRQNQTTLLYKLQGKMAETMSLPFADLALAAAGATTASSYSEAAGTENRVMIYIAGYDLDDADGDNDPFTGVESGILWIQVADENGDLNLETLVSQ